MNDAEATVPDDFFAGLEDDQEAACLPFDLHRRGPAVGRRADRGPAGAGSGRRPGGRQATVRRRAPHQGLGRLHRAESHRQAGPLDGRPVAGPGGPRRSATPQSHRRALAATDGLRQYAGALADGRSEEDHFDALARQLLQARTACGRLPPVPGGRVAAPRCPPVSARASGRAPAAEGGTGGDDNARYRGSAETCGSGLPRCSPGKSATDVLIGQIVFEPHWRLAALKTQLIAGKLSNLGNICHFDPPLADLDQTRRMASSGQFGVVTDKTPETVQRLLQVAGVREATVEPWGSGGRNGRSPAGASRPSRARRQARRNHAGRH